jgi:hypothetical protein
MFSPHGLRDLQLASPAAAERDFLVGRSSEGIAITDGEHDYVVPIPIGTAPRRNGSVGGAGSPTPQTLQDGGASAGGAPAIDGSQGGESAGGAADGGAAGEPAEPPSEAAVAVAPSGRFLLVADGHAVLRQDLPDSPVAPSVLAPSLAVPAPVTTLQLGSAEDCALGYSPGERVLFKLRVDKAEVELTSILLERKIDSVHLLCNGSNCCNGGAVVVHRAQAAPLGQTESYSLVDLAKGKAQLRLSSLRVTHVAAFDADKAVLLSFASSDGSQHELRLLRPFAQAEPSQLDFSITDPADELGPAALPAVGFIGLRRRDGGLLLVLPSAAAASGYDIVSLLDFRLRERVTKLEALP